MNDWKVPVQSLIDHIKTAVDVDPWAKEMAEELLTDLEPKVPGISQDAEGIWSTCGQCGRKIWQLMGLQFVLNPDLMPRFCPFCGKKVNWNA